MYKYACVCMCVCVFVCVCWFVCNYVYLLLQVFMYLLEHDADPNALDISTRSCLLHWAAQRGCTDYVEQLIKYKADVNMMVCVCVCVCACVRVCVCVESILCLPSQYVVVDRKLQSDIWELLCCSKLKA